METVEDSAGMQKNYYRLLELYYANNLSNMTSMLKKCIPDIQCPCQNRYMKKIDRVWIQTNLHKIYESSYQKLDRIMLNRNIGIKNTIDKYAEQYNRIKSQKPELCRGHFSTYEEFIQHTNNLPLNPKKQNNFCNTFINTINLKKLKFPLFSKRNQSYSAEIMNSQNSLTENQIENGKRKSFSSKRTFRVRQLRPNLDQVVNNTRYIEKLERVKLQSTFTELFFHKQQNPESQQYRNLESMDKKIVDKLKAMTNIRVNFNAHVSHKFIKSSVAHCPYYENQKINSLLGVELRKQNIYKPKSKCRSRTTKIFLNI